ncbi:hypothetical protein MtrunA17_Chr3g0095071 [Medicago truncatula]|uniref:Uncharacterized protein n=1 Tax=Medicago truncatula TaxID=3880 RepID=A0A396IMB1_MEDTR|nr:hypothetical protein MtrunA17_Chr3g0095071 [Medicago truncatula]
MVFVLFFSRLGEKIDSDSDRVKNMQRNAERAHFVPYSCIVQGMEGPMGPKVST